MTTRRTFTPWRLACLFVLILAGALYLPSLGGQLIWDDHFLVGGEGIGGGDSLRHCFSEPFLGYYYRPLVSASFYLDHLVWRNTPFGFHQTNILLHVLTTAALMGLLLAAFKRRSIALLGGLIFAVHPVQVSAVAWIGGRTDALCALWMVLFAYALVLAAQSSGRRRTVFTLCALLAYAGALWTKEQMLAALPLVALAFHCFRPGESEGDGPAKSDWKTGARAMLPFVGMSLSFVAAWLLVGPPRPAVMPHGLLDLLAQGGRTVTYYTLLLLAPSARWMHTLCLGNLERAGVWPIALGFAVLALLLFWLKRWLRVAPAAAWFLAFILLTMLPVSNFIPMPSLLVGPYRGAVAGIGVAVLLAWAAVNFRFSIFDFRSWSRRAEIGNWKLEIGNFVPRFAVGVFALWCGWLALWGAEQWKDEKSIFTTIVRCDPYSLVARLNLTSALLSHHDAKPAIGHLETMLTQLFGSSAWQSPQEAARVFHSDPRILAKVRENQGNRIESTVWVAALYGQLGFARMEVEDKAGAKRAFETGEAIDPMYPDVNLGLGYLAHQSGDDRTAIRHLRIAVLVDPKKSEGFAELGKIFSEEGRWAAARDAFAACVRVQPWSTTGYLGLAKAQFKLGDVNGAVATLQLALQHAPNRQAVHQMLAEIDRAHPQITEPHGAQIRLL